MARTFNNSNTLLENTSDVYDNLSFIMVVLRFNAADLTLGSDNNTDIMGLAMRGVSPFGTTDQWAWQIVLDRRTVGDQLHFGVAEGGGGAGANIASITSKISINNWYTLIAAWDGSGQDIWLSTGDTANQASPKTSMINLGALGNDSLKIGGGRTGTGDPTPHRIFDGDLAEVAIYTSGNYPALSEIEAFFEYSPPAVRTNGLASYWPLMGRTSPEIDIVGDYPLTLINSPTVSTHPSIIYPSTPKARLNPETIRAFMSLNPGYWG